MIVECVSVCVNYGDLLAEVAPLNRGLLDRWLVVTEPGDKETREVCKKWDLDVLLSEDAHRDGADFAKGRLVERGMRLLSKDTWHLHMDSDIALPPTFRHQLRQAHLDPTKVYGCDRVMVTGREEWERIKPYLASQHDYHNRFRAPPARLGSRWVDKDQGYVPIGFFQLWHASAEIHAGVRQRPYPQHHNDACRTDTQFALQWDRRQRELLPELVVVHIETQPAPLGANWKGRTTVRFDAGPIVEVTDERS